MKGLVRTIVSLVLPRKKNHASGRDILLKLAPPGGVYAEVGVYKGDFSQRTLEVARPSKLHLIDPWRLQTSEVDDTSLYGKGRGVSQDNMDAIYDGVSKRFEGPIKAGVVLLHRATSLEAAATFPEGYFDFIYIDGDHLYDAVKADLHAYFPKVKPGGYLADDDYKEPGWWGDGVERAADEFAQQPGIKSFEVRGHQFWVRKEGLDLHRRLRGPARSCRKRAEKATMTRATQARTVATHPIGIWGTAPIPGNPAIVC